MEIPLDLIKLLRSSLNVAALTGAGVSKESGLRTFRDQLDGLWTQYRPEDLATPEAFERSPQLVWEFYSARRLKAGQVLPNPGHVALSEMERQIKDFTLITQNVDGLHRVAGNKRVIELHGNITRIKCSRGCGVFTEWEETPGKIPVCPECGANLRPDVVWFGEALPAKEWALATRTSQICRVFFSIGTSGLVQPAASLPIMAKRSGAVLVEINVENTGLSPLADYFFCGKSGEILPEVVKAVWG